MNLETIRFRVRLFFLKVKYRKLAKKLKKLRSEGKFRQIINLITEETNKKGA